MPSEALHMVIYINEHTAIYPIHCIRLTILYFVSFYSLLLTNNNIQEAIKKMLCDQTGGKCRIIYYQRFSQESYITLLLKTV